MEQITETIVSWEITYAGRREGIARTLTAWTPEQKNDILREIRKNGHNLMEVKQIEEIPAR